MDITEKKKNNKEISLKGHWWWFWNLIQALHMLMDKRWDLPKVSRVYNLDQTRLLFLIDSVAEMVEQRSNYPKMKVQNLLKFPQLCELTFAIYDKHKIVIVSLDVCLQWL